MIQAKNHLPPTIQNTISDSNIVHRYTCQGCDEKVMVRNVIMPFGPAKGQQRYITYGCKCEDIQLAKQVLKQQKESKKKRLYKFFDQNSLMNTDLKNCSFDSFEPDNESQAKAKTIASEYSDTYSDDHPKNLLFTGSYGIGKSHLAASALKEIIGKGYTGIFISVPKLLTKLKATYNKKSEHTEDELLSMLVDIDCLVLDDLGAEYGTEKSGSWSISKVFEVVDSRIGKHTIYTTNLNGQELRQKVGERNFSRMMQRTEVVSFSGQDYRLRFFKN